MSESLPVEVVGVVGGGRVGQALLARARRVGIEAMAISSRGPTGPELDALARCEVLIVAVSDGAIGEVASRLAASGRLRSGQVALHTSGLLDASELAPLRPHGLAVGSLHPLCPFSDPEAAQMALPDATFTVEGDEAAREVGAKLGARLGGRVLQLESEKKTLYHAAAVTASNYVATLLDAAVLLGGKAGLPEEVARESFGQLAKAALQSAIRLGPDRALTGPIVRGDVDTVRRHLDALVDDPAERALYVAAAQRTVLLARRAGTSSSKLAAIEAVLDQAAPSRRT